MVQVNFKKLFPNGKPAILAACQSQVALLEEAGITANPYRLALFLAHVSVESSGFTKTVENMRYSAKRLREVWPSRFKSDAVAREYANQPEKLGNYVYGGRMGNGPNEGYKYRGRAGPQLTGKDGYAGVGRVIGVDLVSDPEVAARPDMFLPVAVGFWRWKKVAPSCDSGTDEQRITKSRRLWNGGLIGVDHVRGEFRRLFPLVRALFTTAAPPKPAPAFEVLSLGMTNSDRVEQLQKMLNSKGYLVQEDKDFGTNTRDAVMSFQANNGLPVTGAVDEKTWTTFSTAGMKPISEARAAATEATLKEEGNAVVSSADVVQKVVVTAGAVTAAAKGAKEGSEALPAEPTGGVLDPVINALSYVQPMLEPLKGLRDFLSDHSTVVLGLALAGVYFGVKWIKAARVKEKQTGQAV